MRAGQVPAEWRAGRGVHGSAASVATYCRVACKSRGKPVHARQAYIGVPWVAASLHGDVQRSVEIGAPMLMAPAFLLTCLSRSLAAATCCARGAVRGTGFFAWRHGRKLDQVGVMTRCDEQELNTVARISAVKLQRCATARNKSTPARRRNQRHNRTADWHPLRIRPKPQHS